MESISQFLQEVDEALYAAVDEAIERAAGRAGRELHALASMTSPDDYYADAIMRRLFLRLCGANPQAATGGDPEIAWKILYVGRNVARHWERERGNALVLRKKKERPEDIEKDAGERRQLALAAKDVAFKAAISLLIDDAGLSVSQIDERLEALIDARHARLENVSETDREFTEMAHRSTRFLTGQRK